MDEVDPMGSYSQKQLSIVMVESFPTKMVKSGYCCGCHFQLQFHF
jgi:hypothetical protein